MKAPELRDLIVAEVTTKTNTLLHEFTFPINGTISDLIVVDDYLTGYEIKSDSDTYLRLPKQVIGYDSVCKFNWVVVGESKRDSVHNHVPEYWGIKSYDSATDVLVVLREAEVNPEWTYTNLLMFLPSVNIKSFAKSRSEILGKFDNKKTRINKLTKPKIIKEFGLILESPGLKSDIVKTVTDYLKSPELKQKREDNAIKNQLIKEYFADRRQREIKRRTDNYEYFQETIEAINNKVETNNSIYSRLHTLTSNFLPLCLYYPCDGIRYGTFKFDNEVLLTINDKDYKLTKENISILETSLTEDWATSKLLNALD